MANIKKGDPSASINNEPLPFSNSNCCFLLSYFNKDFLWISFKLWTPRPLSFTVTICLPNDRAVVGSGLVNMWFIQLNNTVPCDTSCDETRPSTATVSIANISPSCQLKCAAANNNIITKKQISTSYHNNNVTWKNDQLANQWMELTDRDREITANCVSIISHRAGRLLIIVPPAVLI